MNSFQTRGDSSSYFSPLDGSYCNYYYYLSVINFILFIYILLAALYIYLFEKKRDTIFQIILVSLPTFLGYFTNRLLYSMCVGSTQA